MRSTRVLFADDHAIINDGLTTLVANEFDVIGTACDGRAMLTMAKKTRPDVVVLDISMPQLNGIDGARILRKELPYTKLLFFTMHSDLPLVEEAIRSGASGYVLKLCAVDELIKAIHCVARGETYITPLLAGDLISTLITAGPCSAKSDLTVRQREVLQLLAEGKTMKEAAVCLNISVRTTESHKYEIMRQLGVKTTAELIRYAVRIKLV